MKIGAAILVFSLVSITPALVLGTPTPIAKWTFENVPLPSTAGPYSPQIGSGSALGHHSGSATYSNPAGNGSANSFSANNWTVGDYWEFSVSTLGYQNITLSWDQISSGTGPELFGLFYSTDGGSFTQFGANYSVLANVSPNAWSSSGSPKTASQYSYDLSSITDLNNASTVYFRLIDESTTSANNGTVAVGGTDRIDNFTVATVPDSLPCVAGLGCVLGLLAVLRRMPQLQRPMP